jgi:hypothetical protein
VAALLFLKRLGDKPVNAAHHFAAGAAFALKVTNAHNE